MITVADAWFHYPDEEAPALRSISLAIAPGEYVAILGPNGSGKSTLARLLNGLLLPARGTVTVNGADTADRDKAWSIRRAVQMIFQNPENQIVGSTLAEDVGFGLSNIGWPQAVISARIHEALALVGLADRRDSSPHALSGGEKQKLAAAAALALDPAYLILDEATAMLDPESRILFLTALHAMRRQRPFGLIAITHHLEEVLGADRIFLLDEGELQAVAPPAELLRRPDLLERCGIEVPFLPALAERLHRGGLTGLPAVPTVEELVVKLCE
jgi:energy-coupling factor transport system ATP-binding protein